MRQLFARKISAVGVVGALALVSSIAVTTSASAQPRFSSLTAQSIQAKGYEDTAITLIAAVRDSSFGPTSVLVGGKVVSTPVTESGARANRSVAVKSKLDVDHRTERTDASQMRVAQIGQTVALSRSGTDAVTKLIDANREIERGATDGHPDVDIVSATVTPFKVAATADNTTGRVLVEVTAYVTDEYRSGVVAESYETTNVVFDASTGKIDAIHPVTDRELAESDSALLDTSAPTSQDGQAADPTWYPEGQVPPELGALVHLGGQYSPTFIKTGMSSTNRNNVVAYANQYWQYYNVSYRSWSSDCTNFVSQAMRAGGWTDTGAPNAAYNYWWYGNYTGQSTSWVRAEGWYQFARVYSGRVTALSYVNSLRPGDVLQVKYDGDAVINHSMIVTLYYGNMVYLTYHSNNRHNVSFTWYQNMEPYSTYYAQQV